MSWSVLIRQTHRWLSIIFTLAVIATFIALAREKPAVWVSYVPLLPLGLLWLTGMSYSGAWVNIEHRSCRPGASKGVPRAEITTITF